MADGTTVPLHYQLAPNELRVDRETLEKEFFALAETEGVSDIEELNKVLERAVTLRNMMKNPQRVEDVAEFVAKHFRETIEPMGYKAFLGGGRSGGVCAVQGGPGQALAGGILGGGHQHAGQEGFRSGCGSSS